MNVDRSLHVLDDMDEVLCEMKDVIPIIHWCVRELADEWSALSTDDRWLASVPDVSAELFDASVDAVSNLTHDITIDIRDFDRALASLIKMRAKLTKELGV